MVGGVKMEHIKDTTGSKIYAVSKSAERDADLAALLNETQVKLTRVEDKVTTITHIAVRVGELETEAYETKYRSDRLESEVRRLSDVTSKQNADISKLNRRLENQSYFLWLLSGIVFGLIIYTYFIM